MRAWALAAACALLPAAGCLGEAGATLACDGDLRPEHVPGDAPTSGGTGARELRVKVLDPSNSSLARVPVVAWWRAADDRVDAVLLRTGGDGLVTLAVPDDQTVQIISGDGAWTHDATVQPGGLATGTLRTGEEGVLELLPALADGFTAGFWTQLVPTGLPVGAVAPVNWDPDPMPWGDAEHLARLEGLDLRLAWTNNMDGYVDLAVGVGRPDGWQVWNQDIQTGPGTFVELHHLTPQDLSPWSDGDLHVGPAAGTYGVVVDQLMGVTYDLRWTATFAVDPTLGDLCAGGVSLVRDVT